MPKVSFEKKLEVAAKVFFRDGSGVPDYPHTTWQQQRDTMRGLVSEGFVNNCYEMNKDDPGINTEVDASLDA